MAAPEDRGDRVRILCLGASYTGRHLAANFGREAHVSFLSRLPERLAAEGLFVADPGNPGRGGPFNLILDTVPAVRRERGIHLPYRSHLSGLMSGDSHPAYIHVSTTSIYPPGRSANREEDLPTCDEETVPAPESARAEDRLLLEQAVAGEYADLRIIRCAGIYGPKRSLAVRFGRGDFSRTAAGNKMVSRIHVHDLCRLVLALGRLKADAGPSLVNAVDRRPSSNRETFEYLERALNITVPGDWRGQQPCGRKIVSRYASSLLGGTYLFPTYREGFADCLSASAPGVAVCDANLR